MSWRDYALARQFLVEERIGTNVRREQRREDKQFQSVKQELETKR